MGVIMLGIFWIFAFIGFGVILSSAFKEPKQ